MLNQIHVFTIKPVVLTLRMLFPYHIKVLEWFHLFKVIGFHHFIIDGIGFLICLDRHAGVGTVGTTRVAQLVILRRRKILGSVETIIIIKQVVKTKSTNKIKYNKIWNFLWRFNCIINNIYLFEFDINIICKSSKPIGWALDVLKV